MKHLEKRFLSPDNIFKIHWVTIKTAAAAAFYNFEPFLTHIRVQILFHFRFLCSGWSGSNPMGSNTCPDSGLQPTAKKKISRSKGCFLSKPLSDSQILSETTKSLKFSISSRLDLQHLNKKGCLLSDRISQNLPVMKQHFDLEIFFLAMGCRPESGHVFDPIGLDPGQPEHRKWK